MIQQGNSDKKFFTTELLKWNKLWNNREMPWKNEKDPYKIWISEIILQQTRVQQGREYYKRFISQYPSVKHLAKAAETSVFKSWEGLGYYSRCKNIIASAKYIVNELKGKFPENFEDILKLKGVGNYTAAAIASFAYDQPYAVLDGNVFRVLARLFGLFAAIDGKDKSMYYALANELMCKKSPGIYNQAIMDFGATVCRPKLPLCSTCPFQQRCFAFLNNLVNALPVKEKIINRQSRWFYYLLIDFEDKLYVRKRLENDIWQNLNEFVLIETKGPLSPGQLQRSAAFKQIFGSVDFSITSLSGIHKQQLTHQTITGQFIRVQIKEQITLNGYRLVSPQQMDLLPFPKFITAYLKD